MPAVPNYPSEPVSDASEPSEHRFIAPIVGLDGVGNTYEHDVSRICNAEKINGMYQRNPDWATAELEAHGGIPRW